MHRRHVGYLLWYVTHFLTPSFRKITLFFFFFSRSQLEASPQRSRVVHRRPQLHSAQRVSIHAPGSSCFQLFLGNIHLKKVCSLHFQLSFGAGYSTCSSGRIRGFGCSSLSHSTYRSSLDVFSSLLSELNLHYIGCHLHFHHISARASSSL